MEINLSKYTLRLRKTPTGMIEVYDKLRKKYVAYTPEEDVRQRFIEFLTVDMLFPGGLICNEIGIVQNGIKRRCDTVILDRNGEPLPIIEYKAPHVTITQRVFDQIYRYNTVLKVKYLIVTNGIKTYCCRNDYENNKCLFVNGIPSYEEMLKQ